MLRGQNKAFDRKRREFDRKTGNFDRKLKEFDRKLKEFDRKLKKFDRKFINFDRKLSKLNVKEDFASLLYQWANPNSLNEEQKRNTKLKRVTKGGFYD